MISIKRNRTTFKNQALDSVEYQNVRQILVYMDFGITSKSIENFRVNLELGGHTLRTIYHAQMYNHNLTNSINICK